MVSVWPMRVFTFSTRTWSPTSWRESLSPVTTTHSQPRSALRRLRVPSRSSASQPANSHRRMAMASSTSFKRGIWTASSSGMGLRVAL